MDNEKFNQIDVQFLSFYDELEKRMESNDLSIRDKALNDFYQLLNLFEGRVEMVYLSHKYFKGNK